MSFPFTAMLSSSWHFFFKWYQSRITVYGWNGNISSMLLLMFLAPSVKNTSLFFSSPLKTRNASIAFIAFFMPHAVRAYVSCPCWICTTVFSTCFASFSIFWLRELFWCFTPTSSMDTYTHSSGEDSISCSSAADGIFSSRDALTEPMMLSTARMSASVFSGMAGEVRLAERQTPSMGLPVPLSNPYILSTFCVVSSSLADICSPTRSTLSERVRSFTASPASRC